MDLRAGACMLNDRLAHVTHHGGGSRGHLAHRSAGTSLIEVLVTLTIVAIGFLGLLGLQTRSASWQRDSFDRKAAAEMVEQFAERVRANHLGFANGEYEFSLDAGASPPDPSACAAPGACTIAQRDATLWLADLRRRIPTVAAYVVRTDRLMLDIRLGWQEPTAAASPSDPVCSTAGLPSVGWRCFVTAVFP